MSRNKYKAGRQVISVLDFGTIDFDERVLICVPKFAWEVARAYLSIQAQWELSYATEYFDNGYEGPSAGELDTIKANLADFLEETDMSLELFSGIVEEVITDTNRAVGTNTLNGVTVPVGEIHVIKLVTIRYVGTVPSKLQVNASGLAGVINMLEQMAPVSNNIYSLSTEVYLQEGDNAQGKIFGATAGDDLFFRYAGYKFNAP